MHPSIKGWKNGWQRFGETLLPLEGDLPEVIALMRYLVGRVSTNHSGAPVSSGPVAEEHRAPSALSGDKKSVDSDATSVLFIPLFSRTYCLGNCLMVAEELHRQSPETSILLLEPIGILDVLPSYVELISVSSLRKNGWSQLPGAVCSGTRFWRAVCGALTKEKILCEEMTRVMGNWKSHLLRWSCLYSYDRRVAAKFLARRNVKSVVTINDVVKPAAPFISAGNDANLQTVVIQHGTPGPQSAPFLAREGWVWGETSQRALEVFGADSSQLKIMGDLESEDTHFEERSKKNGRRTLVFLAQWRATRGWGEPFFQEVFDLLREVLERRAGSWQLRVRLHPTDPAEARADILSRLESSEIKVTLGEDGISMEEELADADALLSVNSSGLMNGISCGIPTAQILPIELEEKIGPALLDTTNHLKDQAALECWLALVEEDDSSLRASNAKILANRGEVAKFMAAQLVGK